MLVQLRFSFDGNRVLFEISVDQIIKQNQPLGKVKNKVGKKMPTLTRLMVWVQVALAAIFMTECLVITIFYIAVRTEVVWNDKQLLYIEPTCLSYQIRTPGKGVEKVLISVL